MQEYTKNPVSDIRLQVNEENVTDIRAELIGPGIVALYAGKEGGGDWRMIKEYLWSCPGSFPLIDGFVEETPYHGGVFEIKLLFGPEFPAVPPKGFFLTPIFHPNVSKTGEICVNTLKKDWKSDCKLSHILMVKESMRFLTDAGRFICLSGHPMSAHRTKPRVSPQRRGGKDVHGRL